MQRRSLIAGLALLVAAQACDSDSPTQPVHSVQIQTAESPSSAAGALSVRTTLTNSGTVTAFVGRCGEQALVTIQVFQNNAWSNLTAPTCATTDPAIELAPGASVTADYAVPAAGRYRSRVTVSSKSDLTNTRLATGAALDVD